MSKDIFGYEKDIMYISTYIPPYGSPFYDQCETNCYILEIEQCIGDLLVGNESMEIICNGDFNARTSNIQINREFSDSDGFDDEWDNVDVFVNNRISHDTEVNEFGRRLLEMCACYDLELLNGCVRFDSSGNFTYLSDHGHSVIDYFLTSCNISKYVEKLTVKERIDSDHMPVEMYCKVLKENCARHEVNVRIVVEKIVWSRDNMPSFVSKISSDSFQEQIRKAVNLVDESLETSLNVFTDALLEAASSMKKTIVRGGGSTRHKAKWFDNECALKKQEVKKRILLYRRV